MLAVVLTVGCYWPGLDGGFAFDDHPNIVENDHLRLQPPGPAAWWSVAVAAYPGTTPRSIAMLSFALNLQLSGLDPFAFRLVNLAIHLLSGLGLGILGFLLLSAPAVAIADRRTRVTLAAVAALAWLVHPFNLTSVLYIVQRMNGLAALFMIWGAVCYARGRLNQLESRPGWTWILGGLLGLGGLAVLSKENGILLPVYLLVVEFVFFRFQAGVSRDRRGLIGLFALTLGLPLLILSGWLVFSADYLVNSYRGRDFTLTERLLTQPRMLLWYLRMLAVPVTSEMGLYLDDVVVSKSLLEPTTTLPSLLGLATLAIASLLSIRRWPLLAFAGLWFLGGHSLESSILPLEIGFEHRNYLPGYGVILALTHSLLRPDWAPRTLRLRQLAVAGWIVLLAFNLVQRSHEWGDELRHALIELEHHPQSVRNNIEAGSLFAVLARRDTPQRTEFADRAIRYFSRAAELRPDLPSALVGNLVTHLENGRSPRPDLIPQLRRALAEARFDASSVAAFDGLTECQIREERCLLPEETFLSLANAALANPTIAGRYRATIYVKMADYIGLLRQDYPRAIEYARLAAETYRRDPQFRLYYATWLMAADDLDGAERQLALVRAEDRLLAVRHRLEAMEAKLRVLRERAQTTTRPGSRR